MMSLRIRYQFMLNETTLAKEQFQAPPDTQIQRLFWIALTKISLFSITEHSVDLSMTRHSNVAVHFLHFLAYRLTLIFVKPSGYLRYTSTKF